MDTMLSCDESDDELTVLEDIRDGSQSHLIINSIEACYKIRDQIKLGHAEWKGALLATQNKGKRLH